MIEPPEALLCTKALLTAWFTRQVPYNPHRQLILNATDNTHLCYIYRYGMCARLYCYCTVYVEMVLCIYFLSFLNKNILVSINSHILVGMNFHILACINYFHILAGINYFHILASINFHILAGVNFHTRLILFEEAIVNNYIRQCKLSLSFLHLFVQYNVWSTFIYTFRLTPITLSKSSSAIFSMSLSRVIPAELTVMVGTAENLSVS